MFTLRQPTSLPQKKKDQPKPVLFFAVDAAPDYPGAAGVILPVVTLLQDMQMGNTSCWARLEMRERSQQRSVVFR